MNYTNVERDFVERTLKILEQYELYAKDLPPESDFHVTFLINCLTGLILLPFEHSKRLRKGVTIPVIFTGDDIVIGDLPVEWGLSTVCFSRLKVEGKKRQRGTMQLRELIYCVRNSLAHSRFEDGSEGRKPVGISVDFTVAEYNPIESVILSVNFVNTHTTTDFHANFPVASLRAFASKVAQSFLN